MPRAMPDSVSSSRSAMSGWNSAAILRSIQWPSRRFTFSPTAGSASSSTKGCDLRRQRVGAGDELADRMLAPHQAALLGHVDLGVGSVVELVRPQRQRRRERRKSGLAQGARLIRVGGGIEAEAEALKPTDELVVDRDFAVLSDSRHQALLLLQPAHEDAGAPVDKSLGQLHVQAHPTGGLLPHGSRHANGRRRRSTPVAAPRRSTCGCRRGRFDSASMSPSVRSMRAICRASQSVGMPPSRRKRQIRRQRRRVLGERHLAEIRHLADVPEQLHVGGAAHAARRGRASGRAPSASRGRRPRGRGLRSGTVGADLEARDQVARAREVERGVPPVAAAKRREAVGLDRLHHLRVERRGLAGDAERAVREVSGRRGRRSARARRRRGRAARARRTCASAGEGDVARRRGSAPCRSRRWRRGTRPRPPGTSRPARCGCAARARRAPPRRRPADRAEPLGELVDRARRRTRPRRERGGRRVERLRARRRSSCESRSRARDLLPGKQARASRARIVSAPRNQVSCRPRAWSRRSVKT